MVHDREEVDPTLAGLSRPGREVVSMSTPAPAGSAARATAGVLASRGDFVASCDDDDLWYPAKVRRQVERLRADPDLLAVGAGIRLLMGERGNVDWPAREAVFSHERLLENRVKELHSSTLMMRRSAFDAAGLYDEELPHGYGEDYDWLLRASRAGKVGAVQEILADIRKDVPSWFRDRSLNTATALEYLLDKHPDFRDRRRGHARILGQIAYARAARGRAAPGPAHRRPCAVPLPGCPARVARPGGRRSRHRAAADAVGGAPTSGGGCREPTAQLPLRRPGQGRVVLAARDADQASRRLPDAREGPLLLRPLLRPRPGVVRRAVPRRAGREDRRRGLPGLPVPPRGGGPDPARLSVRSGSWSACGTRWSGPGRPTSTCASTGSGRTPFAEALRSRPELLEHGRYATGLDRFLQRFPREMVHVALFDDLAVDPQGFLNGVTDFLGVDPLPLADKDLAARLPAARARSVRLASAARRSADWVREHDGARLVGTGQAFPARPASALPAHRP